MRNKTNKRDNTIYKYNKQTGEFVKSFRFNHNDYILGSVYDNDSYDYEFDDFLSMNPISASDIYEKKIYINTKKYLNESAFDDLLDEYEDELEANSDNDSYNPTIIYRTTDDNTTEIGYCGDSVKDVYLELLSKISCIDSADVEKYSNANDLFLKNGSINEYKVLFNDIIFKDGSFKLVIGGPKNNKGIVTLNMKNGPEDVYFIIKSNDIRVNYKSPTNSSKLSFEQFTMLMPLNLSYTYKPINEYYSDIVKQTIEHMNENNIGVTICNLKEPFRYFNSLAKHKDGDLVMREVLSHFTVLYKFTPNNADKDYSILDSLVSRSSNLITNVYKNGELPALKNMINDDYYVLIGLNKTYMKILRKLIEYATPRLFNKENILFLKDIKQTSPISQEINNMICMPFSMFIAYSSILLLTVVHDF